VESKVGTYLFRLALRRSLHRQAHLQAIAVEIRLYLLTWQVQIRNRIESRPNNQRVYNAPPRVCLQGARYIVKNKKKEVEGK
jgi:hypothetical protein